MYDKLNIEGLIFLTNLQINTLLKFQTVKEKANAEGKVHFFSRIGCNKDKITEQ